jgi:hypothetical protein
MVVVQDIVKKYIQEADGKTEIPDDQKQDQFGIQAAKKRLARPEDTQVLQVSALQGNGAHSKTREGKDDIHQLSEMRTGIHQKNMMNEGTI